MTQGQGHPDETPEQGPQPSGKTESYGVWEQGTGAAEPTSPPRAAFVPIEGTIPGFGSLSGSGSSSGGDSGFGSESDPFATPSPDALDESIGFAGALQPGQVLFGRYLAEKLLGEGGMGTVWLVKHLELDTLRALKLIVSGIAFDPQAQARFKREARVMARLSHPHAVLVHDARMGRDAAFIEMEYVRGQSLNKAMTPGVPMPLDWIARILEQLCDVLEEAHNQKIVHRDLKPANLMLLEGRPGREHLKVLDFGIAKILGGDSDSGDVHTHTGSFLGSAPYTSPEQASGGTIDGRSDIYSVGVILYEMMTGSRPFTGPITRLIYDHLYSPPPPFAERNPECRVPAEIEQVVLRCLAKNPDERPQTALELWDEFRNALPEELQSNPNRPYQSLTDRNLGTAPPRRRPNGDSASERTEVATEDSLRVPYRASDAAPAVTHAFGSPAQAKGGPGLGATDWGDSGVAVVTPPGVRSRARLLQAALLLAVLAGAGWGVYKFRTPSAPPDNGLPKGYKAVGSELVHGRPKTLVRERDGVKFHLIEGGTFMMGNDGFDKTANGNDDDQPAHPVTLADFALQEREVTNGELEDYFNANHIGLADRPKRWRAAYERITKTGGDPKIYPAVGVPHELANQYARWVGGRLPTEAQWEYAARSRGKENPYVWEGTEPKPNRNNANVESLGYMGQIPTLVGGSRPLDRTEQGIVDMTGNVREWCRDVWGPYVATTTPLKNPEGPPVPKDGPAQYVMRGGSFNLWADRIRTTRPRRPAEDDQTTSELAEDQTAEDLGFRVVLEWPHH